MLALQFNTVVAISGGELDSSRCDLERLVSIVSLARKANYPHKLGG